MGAERSCNFLCLESKRTSGGEPRKTTKQQSQAMPPALLTPQIRKKKSNAGETCVCNIDFNFNSFYTVCFSVCLRCGVTLAAFLCPVIAVEFEIVAFTGATENAGLENAAPDCRGGKRGTGKRGTRLQGWKTRE